MATITLTVSQEKLEKMYLHYSKHIVKIPNHTLFQAKTANCTITAYLSKKVVFQGKSPEVEANNDITLTTSRTNRNNECRRMR